VSLVEIYFVTVVFDALLILQYFWVWRHVVWLIGGDISDRPAASIFDVEELSSTFMM
jgi:hypothetical protein